jgi:hypothetical protein
MLDAAALDVRGYELTRDKSWQVPNGWFADEGQSGEYRVGIDNNLLYEGKRTLFLRSLVPNPTEQVSVYQSFSALKYRGRRVRLSAWLRTDRADVASLNPLVLQLDDWMYSARSSGTGSWKRYEVVADVGIGAETVEILIQLSRAGTLWVGKLSFDYVESSIPLTYYEPNTPLNLDFTNSH